MAKTYGSLVLIRMSSEIIIRPTKKKLKLTESHSSDFHTFKIFNKFVSKVLSLHDSSISLHTLNFSHNGCLEFHLLKRIVNCAISHIVQRSGLSVHADNAQIPPSIFSSQTLTYFKLGIYSGVGHETMFPKSLNFPALTNLQLWHFAFSAEDNDRAEPFSTFNRLNSLVLHDCTVKGAQTLSISNETLVNLTMDKNIYNLYNIDLSTPSLCNWLLELANIKSLTVSTTTLQDAKLQKAKSQREAARIRKALKEGLRPSSPVPDRIVDFLLQNSPLAEVDFIDRSRRPL
ncbi:hypothetical protein MTR_7g108910 [Medicago truncatula]|uniref:Uncharacterized protein n=1 Tax=Medicago truncatula TaxID=3880 RepID=A0A072UF53_MEDTR|nr:hypothetical protein MTR_7g108910 [Medicago truncatula]